MKYASFLVLILLFACNSSNEKQTKSKTPPALDWLVGNWIRTNGDYGENTHENWIKTDSGYSCHAFTYIRGDTVFQERVKTYFEDNQWHYEVSGPNEVPITFTSTSVTDSSFTCKNTAHDFPKEIFYSTDGECIQAIISDGDDKILFRFERAL